MFAHSFAVFGGVQNFVYFVAFKPYDVFVVLFWQSDFCGNVHAQLVFVEKILEKRANSGDFAGFAAFAVGAFLAFEIV